MYYIVNITKWDNFSQHYYANIYMCNTVIEEHITNGTIALPSYDDTYSLERKCSELPNGVHKISDCYFDILKNDDLKTLINDAVDKVLDDSGLSARICVFMNGKYSKSATLCIENERAVLVV